MARALAVAAAIVSAYGVAQWAGIDFPGLEGGRRHLPVSTLGNTNFASEWIVATLPVVVALAFGSPSIGGKAGFASIAALQVVHLFLTGTRAGPLSLAIATGIVLAWWLRRSVRGRKATGVAALVLLVSLALSSLYVATQWNTPSAIVRRENSIAVLHLAAAHPAIGVGAGNFPIAFPPFRSAVELRLSGLERVWEDAHDEYLQTLAEVGIAGLVLLLLFAGTVLRDALRAFERADSPRRLAIAVSLLAVFANAIFRSPLHNPAASIAFAFVAGAAGKLGSRRTFLLGGARRTSVVGPVVFFLILLPYAIGPLVHDRLFRSALAAETGAEAEEQAARRAEEGRLESQAKEARARERESLERAASLLARACAAGPDRYDYRYRLAKYLVRLQRLADARGALEEALALHPNFVEAKNDLGRTYALERRWGEAERIFLEANAIGPPRPDVLTNLGLVYANQARWDLAKKYLEEARALEPENAEIQKQIEKVEEERR
jgi:tetratricopeptide (TPR) repeat protein